MEEGVNETYDRLAELLKKEKDDGNGKERAKDGAESRWLWRASDPVE
jgi:hypothetical protein